MVIRFNGWGCYGIDKKGKRIPGFSMNNFVILEDMIKKAYSRQENLVSLEIFECWSDYEERRPEYNESNEDF